MEKNETFWSERYLNNQTGWDIGHPSTPLRVYFDQLEDKSLKILIPGAGNAYEAEYLWKNNFKNVYILDIVKDVLDSFASRHPKFPSEQLIHGDFFSQKGEYDLIIEQTFFCSFPPTTEMRMAYAKKMYELLKPGGKLVGLWFTMALTGNMEKRPFGGDKTEYLGYFSDLFTNSYMETCFNSIEPRQGNELFGIFQK